MRTSAIGNEGGADLGGEGGFTLLELLLVLAIMAVVLAWVVPNFHRGGAADLEAEARHLVRLLQLASEEAQLTGTLLRWRTGARSYAFASPDASGEWHTLQRRPFEPHRYPEGITVVELKRRDNLPPPRGKGADARGEVLFYPDGMVDVAELRLREGAKQRVILIRPGAGGIRLQP